MRIRGFFKNDMRYINSRFTYLLTYLLSLEGGQKSNQRIICQNPQSQSGGDG